MCVRICCTNFDIITNAVLQTSHECFYLHCLYIYSTKCSFHKKENQLCKDLIFPCCLFAYVVWNVVSAQVNIPTSHQCVFACIFLIFSFRKYNFPDLYEEYFSIYSHVLDKWSIIWLLWTYHHNRFFSYLKFFPARKFFLSTFFRL